MIKADSVTINSRTYTRTFSTTGHYIIQDNTGAQYEEAVDPENSGRTYTESDDLIETAEISDSEALKIIMGE